MLSEHQRKQKLFVMLLYLLYIKQVKTLKSIDNNKNYNKIGDVNEHLCIYRNHEPYSVYHFQLITGWSCYNYANPKWMTSKQIVKPNYGFVNNFTQYKIPYVTYNDVDVLFDYENDIYTNIIKSFHVEVKFYDKWLSCARNAMKCCYQFNQNDLIADNEHPCPAMWDGYTCYDKTKQNTNVTKLCPRYLTSNDKFICDLESRKECTPHGWNQQTDYARCSSSYRYRDRHTYHVIILAVASSFMMPAIIIFFSYEKLKLWRIALHRNLIIAIFIKNILVLISKNVIIMDAINIQQENSVMEMDGSWCKILTFFENLSKNLIFTCMTADAYHSHKTIARAFAKEDNVGFIYGVIAVASCIPTIIWSIVMGVNSSGKCWVSDSSGYQWITDGYKYACLSVNVILLLDIIRVLFMKYRKSPGRNTGRAIRATVIMVCLFGIPLLISAQRNIVNTDNCIAGDIYTYSTYTIEALQGVFMALLFCYLNPDVINEIKKSWQHTKRHVRDHGSNFKETIRRRTTLLTYTHTTQATTKV